VREAQALGFGRVALPARNVTDPPLDLPTVPVASIAELRKLLE